MKTYTIIAYAEVDGYYSLPRKEKTIQARNYDEAIARAWREFPEYHEVGAFEEE